jgi:hypothetical protein
MSIFLFCRDFKINRKNVRLWWGNPYRERCDKDGWRTDADTRTTERLVFIFPRSHKILKIIIHYDLFIEAALVKI